MHEMVRFFDADDYYWAPAEIPYSVVRPASERHALLLPDLAEQENWILSGSMVSWVGPVLPLFQAAIYITCPTEIRIERLWKRERGIFGARVLEGGDRELCTQEFIEWAAGYDSGRLPGRSKLKHESFIASLTMPLLRLSSLESREEMVHKAAAWLEGLK